LNGSGLSSDGKAGGDSAPQQDIKITPKEMEAAAAFSERLPFSSDDYKALDAYGEACVAARATGDGKSAASVDAPFDDARSRLEAVFGLLGDLMQSLCLSLLHLLVFFISLSASPSLSCAPRLILFFSAAVPPNR
jgi:hypothetical protein